MRASKYLRMEIREYWLYWEIMNILMQFLSAMFMTILKFIFTVQKMGIKLMQ